MRATRRVITLAVLGAGLLAGVIALAMSLAGGSGGPAQALGPITVGFDMNTAGNSCPGTGTADCTLGAIDGCVQVPSGGGVITIDVFLQDLPVDLMDERPVREQETDHARVATGQEPRAEVGLVAELVDAPGDAVDGSRAYPPGLVERSGNRGCADVGVGGDFAYCDGAILHRCLDRLLLCKRFHYLIQFYNGRAEGSSGPRVGCLFSLAGGDASP